MLKWLSKFLGGTKPLFSAETVRLLEENEKFRKQMEELINTGLSKKEATGARLMQAYGASPQKTSSVLLQNREAQRKDTVTVATTPQGMDVLTTMLVVNALVDSSPASVPDCSSNYSDFSSSCGDSSCCSSDFGSCDSSGSI